VSGTRRLTVDCFRVRQGPGYGPTGRLNVANAHDPYFAPGRAWHYSNTNTVLLGMVIESVTHNPVGRELADHIFTPLGLTDTLYPVDPDLPLPFSRGYAVFSPGGALNDVTRASPTSTSASGAMISKLGDLRIWAETLARGALLSPEAQAERLQTGTGAHGQGDRRGRVFVSPLSGARLPVIHG
jgi:D-alanyl-D-alanine carboxypeptidase